MGYEFDDFDLTITCEEYYNDSRYADTDEDYRPW